jgi:hypothetical protein
MNQFLRMMSLPILLATTVAGITLTDGFVTPALGCNYYASPNGGGNGLSRYSPFKIANFWSLAGPGSTLCLLDGVYAHPIAPPENLNGTTAARIIIKALNDGGARIDGGNVRTPIQLTNNDYFLIEGINVHSSVCNVVQIGTGANNNIFRRVIAWNAKVDDNCMVWGLNKNTGNTLEDVAGFGTGRKIFQNYDAMGTIIRRAWGRWENSTMIGPKSTFNLTYGGSDQVCENCIGTWDGTAEDQPQAIFRSGPTHNNSGTLSNSNARFYGSIAYLTNSETSNLSKIVFFSEPTTGGYRDVVVYLSSNHAAKRPFGLITGEFGPCTDCFLTNTTEIGGAVSSIGTGFVVTNGVSVGKVEAAANIWNGADSQGARVCKQYINGKLTSQPLWPWPMNQRIIDAMKSAGKTPVDVTGTMEQIFGTIPSGCRTVSAPPTVAVPVSPTKLAVR